MAQKGGAIHYHYTQLSAHVVDPIFFVAAQLLRSAKPLPPLISARVPRFLVPVLRRTARHSATPAMAAKKAEQQADKVVAAFSQALDTAFEAEIDYIVGALRKNRELTHGLCGMLKADTIQTLMGGRLRAEASSPAAAADRGERQVVRLRSATKRFEQLKTQPAVVLRLLRRILPNHFPEGTCPAISMQSVGVLLSLSVFV